MINKRNLLILCIIMILISGIYLTTSLLISKTDVAVNTFTVGQVSIKLDEAAVNKDGIPDSDAKRVIANTYHLLPGKSYVKDPTITVKKGSETSYVRMIVTLTNAKELKAIFKDNFLPEKYVTGYDKSIWKCVNITENQDNTITYEFRYHTVVNGYVNEKPQDVVLEPLFTNINVPLEITAEQLKTLENFEIRVVGHAIQATGFKSADEAWQSFSTELEVK